MKALIVICSWVGACLDGQNQACRDTFLKDISKFQDLEYRFFIGDGSPTGEDETELNASWLYWDAYQAKANATKRPHNETFTYAPKDDEVVLHVPDGYGHLTYKCRNSRLWALEHGFDYTFQIGVDVYIDLQRLMTSGFEKHDYIGREHNVIEGVKAVGGGGYWLSKKAMEYLVKEPVTYWAEDIWTGMVCNKHGIYPNADNRYAHDLLQDSQYPSPNNQIISTHLGPNDPYSTAPYNPKLMYEVHEKVQKDSECQKG